MNIIRNTWLALAFGVIAAVPAAAEEVKLKLVPSDGFPKIHRQSKTGTGFLLHFAFEQTPSVATIGLGAIEREIGLLQKLVCVQAMLRSERNANACFNGEVVPLDIEGQPKRREHYGATGLLLLAIPLIFSMERSKFEEAGELIRRRFEHEELRLHLGFKAVRAGGGRLTVQGPAGACGDRLEDCNCLAVHQAARHITQVIRAA